MNALRSFGRRSAASSLGDATAAPPDAPPPTLHSAPDTRTWWEKQDDLSRFLIYWAAGTVGSGVVGGIVGNRVSPDHRVLGSVAGAAGGAVLGFGAGYAVLAAQPKGSGGYK